MTPDEIHNERIKLTASWANTIAASILTVGTFMPAVQYFYGILPNETDGILMNGLFAICIGTGLLIHLFGQWILGGLR